jgi:hypothetical protein
VLGERGSLKVLSEEKPHTKGFHLEERGKTLSYKTSLFALI